MANIFIITNGYSITPEHKRVLEAFNLMAEKTMEVKEIEHFYYGSSLIMSSVRLVGGSYGHFNITANRVSFNGHTCSTEEHKLFTELTYRDELFNGKLGGYLQ